jgi:hypothetical protein
VVPPTTAHGDGVFTVCEPVASTPTGTGVYLLLVRGASDHRSSVAGVPAFGSGAATECGPRYTVDGASFRLVGVDPGPLAQSGGHDAADQTVLGALGSAAEPPTARNVLAHLFLGSKACEERLADPFGADPDDPEPGVLVQLLDDQVLPCEVPIAVLTWSFGGVDLIDVWSVRRPPLPVPELSVVQAQAGRARERVGRAAYCQFQDQLADVLSGLNGAASAAFRLKERFRHLPAAGLVPIARGSRRGFSADVLDGLLTRGPMPLAAARVGALLDESVHHMAVDTAAGEVLNVYSVSDAATGTLDHLVFCTSRIALIEAKLAIDSVFPAGLLTVGQRIEVRGRNFGFSTGDCRATFAGVNANPRAGSTDTKLLLDIPPGLAVDPQGSEVTLLVTADSGSDSVPLTVGHPVQQPVGELHVSWVLVDPARLVAGDPARVRYSVLSAVTPAVDVELTLDGTPGVVQDAVMLDENGDPITAPVHFETDESVIVDVAVAAVPKRGFTLSLRAQAGDIDDDDIRSFKPDETIPPADPAITFLTGDLDVQPAGSGELDGSTVRLDEGGIGELEVVARITAAGDYEVLLERKGTSGWNAVLTDPEPLPGQPTAVWTITASDLGTDGKAERTAVLAFRRDGASDTETLTLVVHRDQARNRGSATYRLEPR